MPSNFELLNILGVGCIVAIAAAVLYPAVDPRFRLYHDIVSRSRSMPFTLSCDPDGSVLSSKGSNCLEMRGYRFIRDGLDTVIARVTEDGTTSVVFRWGTPDHAGSQEDLWLASRALRKDTDT